MNYILTESSLVGQVISCLVHQHHPLNLSDHLPISMTIALHTSASLRSSVRTRPINWARAVENGDVHGFAEQVAPLTSPFVHATHQSIHELQWEITYITKGIIDAATRCLPHKKAKKKRSFVKYDQLKDLCKTSKAAWKKWSDAGRPSYGPLAEEKKRTNPRKRSPVQRKPPPTLQNCKSKDRMYKTCYRRPVRHRYKWHTQHLQIFFWLPCTVRSATISRKQCTALSEMEVSSFGNNEQILDTEICVEEIEKALKNLKLEKSGGLDGLSPEHIVYGGEVLKIWLKKIFNRLLTLEELPDCLKV